MLFWDKSKEGWKIPTETKDRIQKDLKNHCKTRIILFLKKNAFLLYDNIQNLSLNLHGITNSTECRREYSNFV